MGENGILVWYEKIIEEDINSSDVRCHGLRFCRLRFT